MAVAADLHQAPLPVPARPTRAQLALVERELAQTSHEVERLHRPALEAVLPVLQQAQRETAHALADWLAKHPDGAERFTAQQRRNLLLQLDRAFSAIARIEPTLAGALEHAGHRAGQMAVRHLTTEVARYSQVFEGTARRLPLNVTRILATGEASLIPRFRTSARRYAGQVRDDLRRELAVGVLRGETVSGLTDRLARLGGFRRAVDGAPADAAAAGLAQRHRYWAERLVRTEVQSAYNHQLDEGIREGRRQLPDLTRRWDASLDGRVCKLCAGLHGKTSPPGEAFEGRFETAPAHPNCRCRVGAWRAAWDGILRQADSELENSNLPDGNGLEIPEASRLAAPRKPRGSGGGTPPPPLPPLSQDEIREVRGAIERHPGLHQWFQQHPAHLHILDTFEGRQEILPRYQKDFGLFLSQSGSIFVNGERHPDSYGHPLVQGVHSMSATAQTRVEAMQLALLHELGHHLIEHLPPPFLGRLRAHHAALRPGSEYLTSYSRSHWTDYYGELVAAYFHRPDELQSVDPDGYALVEESLRHLGIIQ